MLEDDIFNIRKNAYPKKTASVYMMHLKTHNLCVFAGVVHHDYTQYTALTVVAHIKGWFYLSDYEAIISVWSVEVGPERRKMNVIR